MRRRLIGVGLAAAIGGLAYGGYCSFSPRTVSPGASEAVAAERMKRPRPSPVRAHRPLPVRKPSPTALARHVHGAAARHGVPPLLLAAVIAAESEFNPRAVSHRGAVGLMQLMPTTAVLLGVRDAFDPHENVNAGARYLRDLLARFSNDLPLALAAYNAGPQAVIRHRGIPPYPETRAFVARVMQRMREPHSGGVVLATVAASVPAPAPVRVDTSIAEPPSQLEPPAEVVRVALDVSDAMPVEPPLSRTIPAIAPPKPPTAAAPAVAAVVNVEAP